MPTRTLYPLRMLVAAPTSIIRCPWTHHQVICRRESRPAVPDHTIPSHLSPSISPIASDGWGHRSRNRPQTQMRRKMALPGRACRPVGEAPAQKDREDGAGCGQPWWVWKSHDGIDETPWESLNLSSSNLRRGIVTSSNPPRPTTQRLSFKHCLLGPEI